MSQSTTRPFIVGLGGTARPNSTGEKAIRVALAAAEADGAQTVLLAGEDLLMPLYAPESPERAETARRLVDLLRRCDGLIVATPAYHGSISGLVKNALDYTEDMRTDGRVYLDGVPVGCIVTAGGPQAGGQTLAALRAIVHALRGWPTPLGVAMNTASPPFGPDGACADPGLVAQLETVGRQVTRFAMRMQGTACEAPVPTVA